jgi:hypothetical protein
LPPKVFVCILSWNKRDHTLSCLQSVFAQDYANMRVVVVDNGSTDGSLQALREMAGRIDLIEHRENLGFTGGCNAGMRYALAHGGDYVWLLNNDAECSPDTLSRLIGYAQAHPEVGMVSPVICDRGNGVDAYAVGRLDLATGQFEETADAREATSLEQRYPMQIMLKATALLLKRSLIEQVGLFDDGFFAYCEDNDYCVRSAAAGFRAACVTDARVYHDERPARLGEPWRTPAAVYYASRNGQLFWRKHGHGMARWKFGRWHACTIFRLVARGGFEQEQIEAYADGLWSGLRGATGRWDPGLSSHRMPILLRRMIVSHPTLSLALLETNPRAVLRAIRHPAV